MMLEEFVRNPDLHVRRSICTWLRKPDDYQPHLRTLAEEARRIALEHPDEFVRERAEMTHLPRPDTRVQFPALPHRERETNGDNEPHGEPDASLAGPCGIYPVGKAEEAGLDTPGIEGLTEEEKRVLDLLVRGTRSQEIAAHLAISPEMVREHVQSILVKLQVHSRLEAAARSISSEAHPERGS
jgi:DNA-binding CsgD family transcriptional regulator